MKPESSLACSQEPATCFCPEPDKSRPRSATQLMFHLNIIRQSMPTSLSADFPSDTQCTFHFAHMRATCPAHLIFLGLIVQIIYVSKFSDSQLQRRPWTTTLKIKAPTPPKRWYLYTNLNGVKSQNNGIFISATMRTPNLAQAYELFGCISQSA